MKKVTTKLSRLEVHHSSQDSSAPYIHSSRVRILSTPSFFNVDLSCMILCHYIVKRTKINQKVAGLGLYLNKMYCIVPKSFYLKQRKRKIVLKCSGQRDSLEMTWYSLWYSGNKLQRNIAVDWNIFSKMRQSLKQRQRMI